MLNRDQLADVIGNADTHLADCPREEWLAAADAVIAASVLWKTDASNFPPTVPVDESVVALVRLPVGLTMLHDVATALDTHLGPGLVFRTNTGIQGWAVIAKPTPPVDEEP